MTCLKKVAKIANANLNIAYRLRELEPWFILHCSDHIKNIEFHFSIVL